MIPFGVFKSEKCEYIPVEIEVKSEEIRNDEKAELDILIRNSNMLQNLKLKLKYQEYKKDILEIQGNKRLQIPLKNLYQLAQEFVDILELEFYIDNEFYKIEKQVQVKLIKSKKDMLNKKIKSSRSLL